MSGYDWSTIFSVKIPGRGASAAGLGPANKVDRVPPWVFILRAHEGMLWPISAPANHRSRGTVKAVGARPWASSSLNIPSATSRAHVAEVMRGRSLGAATSRPVTNFARCFQTAAGDA